ncbi:NAD-dependent protein deacetylase [Paraburkholderia hiiakae]|uniref:protein acetyllysine N-acetyltransferase n=1 Tax=Paraburkholderia hiiakae TaxID=1081782 RepID=A0ABN7IH02_9BURK|nr:Sir2 family NAD-dependent protein deacetylase [Paraburkholderia hiiakae]CAD6559555.1 NAD-dependent protein deacetylase [Paraburkholderia hiiakae]
MNTHEIDRAAGLIADADALIIAAGAGMSVDSGLPDFRGSQGVWTTLGSPGATNDGLHELLQGSCFTANSRMAMEFYGRALDVCRRTTPHQGYGLLLGWARKKAHGAFVYTSNVDGQFQAAGFTEAHILECHGSIHHFQCARPCSPHIWPASEISKSMRTTHSADWPRCARCGGPARPNVLLFSDPAWLVSRTNAQRLRLEVWRSAPENPVVIEIGAGLALPSVRMFSESLRIPLIRINTHDVHAAIATAVTLQGTALAVLQRIDRELSRRLAPANP